MLKKGNVFTVSTVLSPALKAPYIICIKTNPTIKLISNACMLIQWNGKNILTDPWIIGPAIYGAWVHYPPIKLDIKDITKIDFILISHEHSDHFNEQTLSLLDKDTPIYFPNYKMDRLEKRIRKLGFSNIFSPQSEKITNLTDDIKLIFFNHNYIIWTYK